MPLGLLRPDDTEAQEQRNWDRRSVTATSHAGMVMITADLPALEGETFLAALDALAAAQRAEGDGLSKAQRRADAVITMTNRCAAHGDLLRRPAACRSAPLSRSASPKRNGSCAGKTAPRVPRRHAGRTDPRRCGPAVPPVRGADHRCGRRRFGDAAVGLAAALSASHPEPLALGRSVRIATSAQRRAWRRATTGVRSVVFRPRIARCTT